MHLLSFSTGMWIKGHGKINRVFSKIFMGIVSGQLVKKLDNTRNLLEARKLLSNNPDSIPLEISLYPHLSTIINSKLKVAKLSARRKGQGRNLKRQPRTCNNGKTLEKCGFEPFSTVC